MKVVEYTGNSIIIDMRVCCCFTAYYQSFRDDGALPQLKPGHRTDCLSAIGSRLSAPAAGFVALGTVFGPFGRLSRFRDIFHYLLLQNGSVLKGK